MIGGPTNFRHIGHMGAGDLTSSCKVCLERHFFNIKKIFKIEAVNCLLSSKGSEDYAIPVPSNLREKDIPIQPETTCQVWILKIIKFFTFKKYFHRFRHP